MSTLNSGLFKNNITVWRTVGSDDSGFPLLQGPTVEKAYVCKKNKLIQKITGQEVLSESEIYTTSAVNEGDYIYIGTSVESYPPVDAKRVIISEEIPSLRDVDVTTKVAYL